ncbi:MAG: hypothetical protein ACRDRQ_14495 [Pseudonocardiaceae bacterium]
MLQVAFVSTPCVRVFLCLTRTGATAKAAANGRAPTVTGPAPVDGQSPRALNGNRAKATGPAPPTGPPSRCRTNPSQPDLDTSLPSLSPRWLPSSPGRPIRPMLPPPVTHEVERIWLPFAVWLVAAAGLLPARQARWWLAAQVAVALAVNHLLLTMW